MSSAPSAAITPATVQTMTRDELAAAYVELIGYDPFKDDPATTPDYVRETLLEYLAEARATFAINSLATFQKVSEGWRALWDEEGLYNWGDFVAAADFNADEFRLVTYAPADFENQDPYYQRQICEEVVMELGDDA